VKSVSGVGLFSAVALLCVSPGLQAGAYTFQTLDNPGDPAFNQLLGINNGGTIAGYFGDGMAQPNKGYTLSSPYGLGNYTNENFPGSVQTQVVGINNNASPITVGFWIDGNNNNFGFVNQGGSFTSVFNPATPAATPSVNQLLGVNNSGVAAGFYVDGAGNAQAYLYNIMGMTFTAITLPGSFSAAMTTATGINNAGIVVGFYTDGGGVTHGFIDNGGSFTSLDDPNANGNTEFLGLNNNGYIVGSFLDASDMTNGLLYNIGSNSWQTVDDPSQSATPAFGVTGTTINGINDKNQLVGFYSDVTNVNGFLATTVTPEPGSAGLVTLALAGAWYAKRRHRRT